jgi:hypothetical protein
MTRYESGLDAGLDPFTGSWRPAGGPVTALAVAVIGLIALTALVTFTERDGFARAVTELTTLENGSVTPNGQTARDVTKASTTDVASH